MGTVGTFDAFTTARLGIYAAYKGLSLTGNNISNINTPGYTRQVLDQVSLKTGANDMYRSQYDNHIGNGTLVTGINQIRDPYLDIRYRNTSADVGYYDESLGGMQEIAKILDEVGKGDKEDGMLYAQLQNLADSLRAISSDPNKDNDTLARTSADALVGLFNKYADKLENLRLDFIDSLNQDVRQVNGILANIRNLNELIRESDVHGDNALEMRDERNRQIDELSQYMHIKVTYSMEDIGGGLEVERCTVALANDNPDPKVTTDSSILVDGIYGAQIDIPEKLPVENPDYNLAAAGRNKDKLAANPKATDLEDAGFRYVKADKDGNPIKGAFTNNIDEAAKVDNENYTVTISKLLDAGGKEWTKPVTTWEVLKDGDVGVKAKYTYDVTSSGWKAGDTIKIGNKDYQIGDTTEEVDDPDNPGEKITVTKRGDISVADANRASKMAEFIASKLDGTDEYKDYYVRAKDGTIIFTAKEPGDKTDKEPNLTLEDGGEKIKLSDRNPVRPGVDVTPPTGYQEGTVTTWDENGTKTEVTYIAGEKNWLRCTVTTQYTYDVTLDDNDLHGSLQAARELLTEKGEFASEDYIKNVDENAAIKRGIPYYQKSFDLLAKTFAEYYNKLNDGFMVNEDGNYIKEDGTVITLGKDADGKDIPVSKTSGLTAAQIELLKNEQYTDKDGKTQPLSEKGELIPDALNLWLQENNAKKPEGVGVLFSNRGDSNDTEGITAANISVSAGWSSGAVKIVPTMVELFGKQPEPQLDDDGNPLPNTTQNENVNHMISLIGEALLYDPRALDPDAKGTKLFQGSFNDMFSNMNIVLGNDQRKTTVKLNSQYTALVEVDSSREGVSGVDLNDEAMNMMQYQKAYSAACRIMTAIDEVLDRLINNTGVAGR